MTTVLDRTNILLAAAGQSRWAGTLADRLADAPVHVHWSATDHEAVGMAADGRMHLAMVDEAIPTSGGLDVLRRIRRLGIELPCMLVCQEPDARLLKEALALSAFSVVHSTAEASRIVLAIERLMKRVYGSDWTGLDHESRRVGTPWTDA